MVRQTTDIAFALQRSILNAISHNCVFLDNTAHSVLNSSFVETHPPSLWMSNSLFEGLFLPEKETNYKTSTVVSPQA